ncbi:MAG: serine hydrolase domain-containing protein [Bacteroidota bacterium]
MKIRHLLTHSSGLLDYENLMPDTLSHQLSDAEVLLMLEPVNSLDFPPGSAFRYSNGGYCLLAQIVEKVSGKTFANFLSDNIFKPIGMKNTCVFEQRKRIKNRAFGYAKDEQEQLVFSDQSLTSATQGDGGVYTSLDDYLKWHRALASNYFLDLQATLEKVNVPLPGGQGKYGAGWFFAKLPENEVEMFHSGSTCGFSNDVIRAPGKGVLVVFFSNIADNHVAFAPVFERLKQDGLLQVDYRAWHQATN